MQNNSYKFLRARKARIRQSIAEACNDPKRVVLYASSIRNRYLLRWANLETGVGGVISANHGLAEHIELSTMALAAIQAARRATARAAA